MPRSGNLNPQGAIFGLASWHPYSTVATLSVPAAGLKSLAVPSQARGVLMTADVDMVVGLSTGVVANEPLTASAGHWLNAGTMWPPNLLPASTAAFKVRGVGTDGLATIQFLTFRSL